MGGHRQRKTTGPAYTSTTAMQRDDAYSSSSSVMPACIGGETD